MTDQLKELERNLHLRYLNSWLREEKAKRESYNDAYKFHDESLSHASTDAKVLTIITNCNVAAMLMDACGSDIESLEEQIAETEKEGKE